MVNWQLLIHLCIALNVAIFSVACSQKPNPQAPGLRPVNVKFEKAKIGPITQYFETVGELKADREITVSAEKAGQIAEIFVREGDWVKQDQVLVQIKGEDVEADLAKAQADYEAYSKLHEEGAVSQQELLQYETTLKRYQAILDNLKIKAISSGVIGEIHVDPGDYVNLGAKILELVKNKPLRVSYSVPEKIIPAIKPGQKVEITTDSYPGKVFYAYIDFISPKVDPVTRAILLRAKLRDDNSLLKANQFTKIRQLIKSYDKAILIREEALYLDQGQEYLYLAIEEEENSYIADRKAVETGLRENGYVQIIHGVSEDDLVIYAGLHSIYPGAKLAQVQE